MTRLHKNEKGAVYVEFLLVFFPVFIIFLGLIQASLLFAANLMVRHAATIAARAAMVVLDDDPAKYGDEERGSLTGDGSGSGDDTSVLCNVISLIESDGSSTPINTPSADSGSGDGSLGGKRLAAIRSAAQTALLGLSPPLDTVTSPGSVRSVSEALGAGIQTTSRLAGAELYNQFAVAVTFPQAYGDDSNYRTSFSPNDTAYVRVSYLFHCAIPIAKNFVCDSMASFMAGIPLDAMEDVQSLIDRNASAQAIQDTIAALNHRRQRVADARPGLNELDEAAMPSLRFYTLTGGRYSLIRGEAAMPNHSAWYEYPEDD